LRGRLWHETFHVLTFERTTHLRSSISEGYKPIGCRVFLEKTSHLLHGDLKSKRVRPMLESQVPLILTCARRNRGPTSRPREEPGISQGAGRSILRSRSWARQTDLIRKTGRWCAEPSRGTRSRVDRFRCAAQMDSRSRRRRARWNRAEGRREDPLSFLARCVRRRPR